MLRKDMGVEDQGLQIKERLFEDQLLLCSALVGVCRDWVTQVHQELRGSDNAGHHAIGLTIDAPHHQGHCVSAGVSLEEGHHHGPGLRIQRVARLPTSEGLGVQDIHPQIGAHARDLVESLGLERVSQIHAEACLVRGPVTNKFQGRALPT